MLVARQAQAVVPQVPALPAQAVVLRHLVAQVPELAHLVPAVHHPAAPVAVHLPQAPARARLCRRGGKWKTSPAA